MSERDILRTELRWSAIVAGAVGLIVVVIVISSAAMVLHPPSNVEVIEASSLHLSQEFAESNLGAIENPDGTITARIVATQFAFTPQCVPVPANRKVTIRMTSPDVIHGMIIIGTNVNTMVVPGYISQVNTRFPNPGNYAMPCHEYCGLGHGSMWSRIRVLPEEEWAPDEQGRVRCEFSG